MEETQEQPIASSQSSKRVLVFAKHDYVVSNATQILTRGGFSTKGFTNLMEATDEVRTGEVDVVLIMGGVDPHDKISLTKGLPEFAPHAKVVEHFGGPATILHEVLSVLQP